MSDKNAKPAKPRSALKKKAVHVDDKRVSFSIPDGKSHKPSNESIKSVGMMSIKKNPFSDELLEPTELSMKLEELSSELRKIEGKLDQQTEFLTDNVREITEEAEKVTDFAVSVSKLEKKSSMNEDLIKRVLKTKESAMKEAHDIYEKIIKNQQQIDQVLSLYKDLLKNIKSYQSFNYDESVTDEQLIYALQNKKTNDFGKMLSLVSSISDLAI